MQNEVQTKAASVKIAYQILGEEIGINPSLAAEAVDVTACLTPVVEEAEEINKEELEEFCRDLNEFLKEEQGKEISPVALPLGLWIALLPNAGNQKQREKDTDPMFG